MTENPELGDHGAVADPGRFAHIMLCIKPMTRRALFHEEFFEILKPCSRDSCRVRLTFDSFLMSKLPCMP